MTSASIADKSVKTNPVSVRKTLAVISILFGIFVCWVVLYSPVRDFLTGDRQLSDYLFILPMVAMMAVVGLIPLGAGIRLYKVMDEAALKCSLGSVALVAAVSISVRLSSFFPKRFPPQIQDGLFLLVGAVVAIFVYLITLRKLLEMLGQGKPRFIWLLSKVIFGLFAWQVWMLLSGISHEYTKGEAGSRFITDSSLGLLVAFGPTVIALVGYKLATTLLERSRRKSLDPQATSAG